MKTVLKVTSVLNIIYGILGMVAAIALFIGSGILGAASMNASGINQSAGMFLTGTALFLGILTLISGLFNLIAGIKGWQGAKGRPDKLKTALVFGWISLVLCAISAVLTIWSHTNTQDIIEALLGVVIPVLFVISGTSVKNELG